MVPSFRRSIRSLTEHRQGDLATVRLYCIKRDTHLRARGYQLTCLGHLQMAVLRPPNLQRNLQPQKTLPVQSMSGWSQEVLQKAQSSFDFEKPPDPVSFWVGCCQGFLLPPALGL